MGRLGIEGRTAMAALLERGHSQNAVARLLGVTEGTVRYHRKRRSAGAADGRSQQDLKAAAHAGAIAHWRDQQADGRVNLAALHDWLRREHGYDGSLKSVQRYWKRTFPAPAIRARRRVETPAGAQAQVDWAEFPGAVLGDEVVDLVALIVTLSWSRKRAVVWARSKDMLSWQACQIACFQRLGGVPAVLRIDNVKTAIARGAGAWGVINETYRRFAVQLAFHVDACQPRHPQGKGKVERHVRDLRETVDPRREVFDSLERLQAVTDARLAERTARLRCPATGAIIDEAWDQERRLLTPDALGTLRRRRASPGRDRLPRQLRRAPLQRAVPLRRPGGGGARAVGAGADPQGCGRDRRPPPPDRPAHPARRGPLRGQRHRPGPGADAARPDGASPGGDRGQQRPAPLDRSLRPTGGGGPMTPMTAPRVKLDIDATREKLAALGLGHAVDALEGLLTDAVRAEMPAHVFLDRLLGAERSGREERRITTMLKTSKLPTGQTLENFDFAFQPAIERSRVETLATGAWIRNAEVVLLQGPPGVGKSHILVGLGVRAIQLGFSVQYFRFDELLTALKADAHVPPARLKSRKYMSSALLLVDEMGYDPMSREEASLFFRLVSYRYGRGAMIITTNKSIRDWTELLAGDEALATAILDRLLHRSHVLNIKGRSYRLRDLEAALKG
jgi:DNA replication protein DnaC/transposase